MAAVDPWRGLADQATRTVRDVLGISATYTPVATGIPMDIRAPFDDAYVELILEGGIPDTVERTVLDVRMEDLPGFPEPGDRIELTRMGETAPIAFIVEDVERGGQGTVDLILTLETAP